MEESKKTKIQETQKLYISLALLITLLILCNQIFPSSTGWSRLFWSTVGYVGLYAIYRLANLTLDDIGLKYSNIKNGLKYAGLLCLIIFTGLLIAFLIDRSAFRDTRYHHNLPTVIYASFVLLPLKTVIFEELAFRGLLLALLLKLKNNRYFAVILSSLMFGLWHVRSADAGNLILPSLLSTVFVVTITTVAGIIFCELRLRSKSLIAPITLHWFINAAATLFAAISWSL